MHIMSFEELHQHILNECYAH